MLRSLLLGAAIVTLVVACSSATGTTTGSRCDSYASAVCTKLDACSHFAVALEYGDVATCTTRTAKGCQLGIDAPGTGVTAANLDACSNALGAASCDDLLGGKPPDACKTPAGTLADGAACGEDAQCSGRRCRKSGATCGACSKRGAAGDSCTTSSDCEEGLRCSGTCAVPVQAGGTCDTAHSCAIGLFCKAGVCAKSGGAGEACQATGVPGECNAIAGLYCNPQSKVCETITLLSAGQSCSTPGSLCSAASTCVGTSSSRTCLAPAADGAPCDDVKGPHCLGPATCENGVCTLDDPAACK